MVLWPIAAMLAGQLLQASTGSTIGLLQTTAGALQPALEPILRVRNPRNPMLDETYGLPPQLKPKIYFGAPPTLAPPTAPGLEPNYGRQFIAPALVPLIDKDERLRIMNQAYRLSNRSSNLPWNQLPDFRKYTILMKNIRGSVLTGVVNLKAAVVPTPAGKSGAFKRHQFATRKV